MFLSSVVFWHSAFCEFAEVNTCGNYMISRVIVKICYYFDLELFLGVISWIWCFIFPESSLCLIFPDGSMGLDCSLTKFSSVIGDLDGQKQNFLFHLWGDYPHSVWVNSYKINCCTNWDWLSFFISYISTLRKIQPPVF